MPSVWPVWIESPAQVVQLSFTLSALATAPLLLCMVTPFTRVLITFSFVRQGMGMAIPSVVITGLSLIFTCFSMQEVFWAAYREGYQPLMREQIGYEEAALRIASPFQNFMKRETSPKEAAFVQRLFPAVRKELVLIPAFVLSELKRGFEQGFLLLLPFLVIDVLVSAVLLSMGMMMVQPASISLPLKLAFFISTEGWMVVSKVAVLGP